MDRQSSLVSIIVPARNEETNIGDCLRSLLAQGDGVEIIVADDASEDSTAEIVRDVARQTPNVKLLSVPPLPLGWLGKNHALHAAVPHATGKWFLFTDADTRHAEGVLREVVNRAARDGLDLLSYSPPQRMETWWEKAVIPQVFVLLARRYPFERVNDPRDPLAAANGQYLLIRREAYERIGGHAAVSGEMLEDVALARRAKQAGRRIWFGSGEGIVTTRMYRTFAAMWEGWTKNLFLLFQRDRRAVRGQAVRLAVPIGIVFAGLGLFCWGFWEPGVALLLISLGQHILFARSYRGPNRIAATALFVPGRLILFLLLLNSERRYSRNLEIVWKGRRYRAGTGPQS